MQCRIGAIPIPTVKVWMKKELYMKTRVSRARYLTCTAIMSAVATILMFLDFSIPIMPGFIKLDFSELPALLATFALGPVSGILVCLFKNVINVFFTTTAAVGELVNFLLGVLLVVPAGLIYKYKKTRLGAFLGALLGSACMAGFGILLNYYITYPIYAKVMAPMPVILGSYKLIYPGITNLWQALAIFNVPFTFVKGLLNTIICLLIYKPLSPIIKGYGTSTKKKTIKNTFDENNVLQSDNIDEHVDNNDENNDVDNDVF